MLPSWPQPGRSCSCFNGNGSFPALQLWRCGSSDWDRKRAVYSPVKARQVRNRMLVETVDPSMNDGNLPFWKLVRLKYAGSRSAQATHHACHSMTALIKCGGTELCLRREERKESGNVVVWQTTSTAPAFSCLRASGNLAFRAHSMVICKDKEASSKPWPRKPIQGGVWIEIECSDGCAAIVAGGLKGRP